MKCFRYCSVLLLCFALFLGVFSVGVSATSVNFPKFQVTARGQFVLPNQGSYTAGEWQFSPRNGVEEKRVFSTNESQFTSDWVGGDEQLQLTATYIFRPKEGSVLISAGGNYTLQVLRHYVQFIVNGQYSRASTYSVLLLYTDGTAEYLPSVNIELNSSGGYIYFTPKKDVAEFEIHHKKNVTLDKDVPVNASIYVGEYNVGDSGYELLLDVRTDTEEKLDGILGFLSVIKDGITGLFDSIAQLPAKIWEFISNGLKSLFVPSEEFITDYKDRMDTMLAEKLGAVYECSNVLFESWDRITDSDDTNTIEFPATTIDVGGIDFTFGGYQVEIVPHGFDFLANAVKLIVAILCTIAFVNGMRKRYDEVMGG